APYQDDDFVGLQVVLHIDPNVINDSLVDIHGGGEEIDRQLLDQIDFDEPNGDAYISSEGRGVRGKGQPTINSPTSTIHISTSESAIPIIQWGTLSMVQKEPQPTFVGDVVATPSAQQDSLTPEYSPLHFEHVVDQRPFLQEIDKEFTLAHGPCVVISQIIRQKFDEPWLTWKKQKYSRIFKNAMNKIRNGLDHATWVPPNVQVASEEHWSSTDFENKSSIDKANRANDKGASTYCSGSISTSTHYEKMAIELQQPPSAWKVVEKTKKLRTREWINDKTHELVNSYNLSLMKAHLQMTHFLPLSMIMTYITTSLEVRMTKGTYMDLVD
ncbi:hypothetical protein CR513_13464, partial [Mucuna pruriens]